MTTPLRSLALAVLVGAALTLYAQRAAAPIAPPTLTGAAASQYVPGEVLVKFKRTASMQGLMAARGHSVVANLDLPGWAQVKFGAGQAMETALTAYRNDPNVEYVQPNYIYRATAVPNDTEYSQLWAFKNTGQEINPNTYLPNAGTAGDDMNIEPAWGHITDCSSVVVAVLDYGVNYTHQDLAANMWNGGVSFPNHGYDFVDDDDDDPMDLNGHGTHVAGIIGAEGNNSTGTTGVCQKAKIMAVRVLDAAGDVTTATALQGISFAVTNGAKVINMSFAGRGPFDQLFSDAITYAQNNDVVVVVSAGNETQDNDAVGASYPCNFAQPNLVCVAALDQNYALASFSNWGATSVDVGAPGTNIRSAWAGAASYNTISGTSMASPEVAGLAAMLRAYNPQYTYADTVGAIKNGGRSVPALAGKTTTGKAVDVMSSLAYINPPTGLAATVR